MRASVQTKRIIQMMIVRSSSRSASGFFILTASGMDDFAYSGFRSGVMAMAEMDAFTLADNEYLYNAWRFFWNAYFE